MSVAFIPPPRRLLVRGVNWLGDAVMTTPALLRLREKFPTARITLLAPEKLRELWQHHPAVDETISFTSDESVLAVAKKLRAGKFDLALILPNSPRSALEVFFAGVPQRFGYARPWRNFFLTRAIAPRQNVVKLEKRSVTEIQSLITALAPTRRPIPVASHQVYEYLHLAAATLGTNPEPLPPQLHVTPEEISAAAQKFGLDQVTSPIFGLNPGAEYGPAKRWPVDRFIAAAKEIQRRTDCAWIFFGGKNDRELTAQIASALPPSGIVQPDLAGSTSLRELMALLKSCRVLLTNDTGPMHVAAALGTPLAVPFGSTSSELTGPGLPTAPHPGVLQSDAPCSPCFLRECPIDFRCMTGLTVDRVVTTVLAAQAG